MITKTLFRSCGQYDLYCLRISEFLKSSQSEKQKSNHSDKKLIMTTSLAHSILITVYYRITRQERIEVY